VRRRRTRQRANQGEHADFGHVVGQHPRLRGDAIGVCHRERQDPAPFLLDHAGHGQARAIEERIEIVRHHVAPALGRLLERRAAMIGPGGVDQRIGRAERPAHFLEQSRDVGDDRNVRLVRASPRSERLDLRDRRFRFPFAGPKRNRHVPALLGEVERDRASNSAGPAGHECCAHGPTSLVSDAPNGNRLRGRGGVFFR
jgi:hypothetical protein